MIKIIFTFLIIATVVYILYINGYLVLSSKRAAVFIGSKRGNKAEFSYCTGYIKRVVRFKGDKTYTVTLASKLTKGEMKVKLLDSAGQELMCLNSLSPTAVFSAENNKRYYLMIHFKSASGNYELNWEHK